ncbi:unnamed protein product [Caretta caretta]
MWKTCWSNIQNFIIALGKQFLVLFSYFPPASVLYTWHMCGCVMTLEDGYDLGELFGRLPLSPLLKKQNVFLKMLKPPLYAQNMPKELSQPQSPEVLANTKQETETT